MRRAQIILTLLTVSCYAFAQDFEVPRVLRLNKAEDYAKYEKDVLACVDWMTATPANKEFSKRKKANEFLLTWLNNNPTVDVSVNPEVVTFVTSSPDLLNVFMAGWTKYSLESGDADKAAGNLAGVHMALDYYTANKATINKDKNVEKFLKMRSKNTLEKYIKESAVAE